MPTSIQKTGILFDRAVENPVPITGRAQGAIASAQKSTRTLSTAARLPWWRPEGRLIDPQPDGRNGYWTGLDLRCHPPLHSPPVSSTSAPACVALATHGRRLNGTRSVLSINGVAGARPATSRATSGSTPRVAAPGTAAAAETCAAWSTPRLDGSFV
jgi:hypothetical protein